MLAEPPAPGSDFLNTKARAMMKYSGDMRSPCSTPPPMLNSRDVTQKEMLDRIARGHIFKLVAETDTGRKTYRQG